MKRVTKKFSTGFLALLMSTSSLPIYASGIPTFDGASVVQNTITALNTVQQYMQQIQEYKTQLLQYENQLKNSLAPAAYIWSEALKTMNDLQRTVNDLKALRSQLGDVNTYLEKFGDISYYQNASCYTNQSRCHEEFHKQRQEFSKLQKAANDALTKGISAQNDAIIYDSQKLQQLQSRAQTAQGQMEALQYANQLAAAQNNQMLQFRQIMLVQMEALNTAQQVDNARRSQMEAATKKLHALGNTMGLRP
ncbi:TPA: P-type conjugative transfer protein TrbJ [Pasteurella multocida]